MSNLINKKRLAVSIIHVNYIDQLTDSIRRELVYGLMHVHDRNREPKTQADNGKYARVVDKS